MRKFRGFAPFSHTAHLRFYKKKSTGMAWVDMAVAWNLPCGRNHTLDVLNRVTVFFLLACTGSGRFLP
jgi:hypothetical protein